LKTKVKTIHKVKLRMQPIQMAKDVEAKVVVAAKGAKVAKERAKGLLSIALAI
jgi:hypothetical protein